MEQPKLENIPVQLSEDESLSLRCYFPVPEPLIWEIWQTMVDGVKRISLFATMPAAYICFYIDTTPLIPRMKARDVLKHNYKEIHGNLTNLKSIGYCNIQHSGTRMSMINAARALRGDSHWDYWLVIRPGGIGWNEALLDNPFIRGAQMLCIENAEEMLNAYVGKVSFFCETPYPSSRPWHEFELYMRIELYRQFM
ncbi:hypothetical protein F4774DRAFT_429349 [Daldinia eschscholtzii]|nr:hypothetical protein F4774DRAFT_429349 [Daldinia eschscholtzii]